MKRLNLTNREEFLRHVSHVHIPAASDMYKYIQFLVLAVQVTSVEDMTEINLYDGQDTAHFIYYLF
jgi:hypothetical protein